MYRSPISSRLSLGRSTPAIRAMSEAPLLPLPLLVPWVGTDHEDPPAPADHTAAIADLLDRWSDLHDVPLICTDTPHGLGSGRTAITLRGPGRREGSGCSASASSRRYGRAPCARSPAQPGTWHWGGAPRPSPRPRSHRLWPRSS